MNKHDPLPSIIAIAEKLNLVLITYNKGVTKSKSFERIIEPYSLTQGKQDLMIRCYQREPEEGWRFFMLHKIDQVKDTGKRFSPRRKISLPTGEITKTYEQSENWPDELQMYRDMVGDALADGKLTPEEFKALENLKKKHKISVEHVRFVHASIYHRCLGAIIEDGIVDDEERAQLRFLHKVLSRLGWTVSE